MKKTYFIILLICITILTIGIYFGRQIQKNTVNEIYGTYKCDELPLNTLVFDDNKFYYYNYSSAISDEQVITGEFIRNEDMSGVLVSDYFLNQTVTSQGGLLTVAISGNEYTFYQDKKTPLYLYDE